MNPILKGIRLNIPLSLLQSLEGSAFIQSSDTKSSVNYGGYNDGSGGIAQFMVQEASHWMVKSDCAFVSAWRGRESPETNRSNNEKLKSALKKQGYGVAEVTGRYAEAGMPLAKEDSFFVYTTRNTPQCNHIYESIYDLAHQFNQDSFIYKPTGKNEHALLVYTNDDLIRENGGVIDIGSFYINEKDVVECTEFEDGIITFH